MRKFSTLLFVIFSIFLGASVNIGGMLNAQSAYLDMTIVESSNYNNPLGVFSYDEFQNQFKITSHTGETHNEDITRGLILFLKILEPQKSYIIQHEPTYYFVFKYNKKENNYLVMNNSIGESNEAIYVSTFAEAQKEMLNLLLIFYSNTPAFSATEYR